MLSFDDIETENNTMQNGLHIGFNCRLLLDIFNVVDNEKPIVTGTSELHPLFVKGDEYHFLILPIKIVDASYLEGFEKYFRKAA